MHITARPVFLFIAMMLVLAAACSPVAGADAILLSSVQSPRSKPQPPASPALRLSVEQPSCLGVGCHEDPAAMAALSVHPPYAESKCTFCHGIEPHGLKASLSPADSITLCFACHKPAALELSHRMGVGMTDPRSGSTVTCATCHPPHFSDYPHRLTMEPGPALCSQCHSDYMPNPDH